MYKELQKKNVRRILVKRCLGKRTVGRWMLQLTLWRNVQWVGGWWRFAVLVAMGLLSEYFRSA